jgi:hypothetical protein
MHYSIDLTVLDILKYIAKHCIFKNSRFNAYQLCFSGCWAENTKPDLGLNVELLGQTNMPYLFVMFRD